MRYGLPDLAILGFFYIVGALVAGATVAVLPKHSVLGIILGIGLGLTSFFVSFLSFGSAIYRRLRLRPLLLPRCPCCHKRSSRYVVSNFEWPIAVVTCCLCKGVFVMLHDRNAQGIDLHGLPCVELWWPESLGIWREISNRN